MPSTNRSAICRTGSVLSHICWFFLFSVALFTPPLLYAEFYNSVVSARDNVTILRFSPAVKKSVHLSHPRIIRPTNTPTSDLSSDNNTVRVKSRKQGQLSDMTILKRNNTRTDPYSPELPPYLNDTSADSAIELLRAKLLQLKKLVRSGNRTTPERKRYGRLYQRYQLLTGQKDLAHPHPAVTEMPSEPGSDLYFDSTYYYPFQEYRLLYHKPLIAPLRALSYQRRPQHPFAAQGIVYYLYSSQHAVCNETDRYVKQTLFYTSRAKRLSPSVSIALVTNCHLPRELFRMVDVVVPIAPEDLIPFSGQNQFTTRMIYNAFPPFETSLVLDTHTNWCAGGDPEEAFSLFRASDVDLAFSTRVVNRWVTSGFAVLYRYNARTFDYWQRVTKFNRHYRIHGDDQYGMRVIATDLLRRNQLRFRWLSNNWFFALHGVNQRGEFIGSADCYRASVLVNGRIRFIHAGIYGQCELMNRGSSKQRVRAQFAPGSCAFSKKSVPQLVFSQKKMEELVRPFSPPRYNWTLLEQENPDALFWFKDKGFI